MSAGGAGGAEGDLDPGLRRWLEPLVGGVALVRPLVGGITGQMLQLRPASGGEDLVVRRWRSSGPEEQDLVRREVTGLEALTDSGLPIPRLLAADPDGSGSGLPSTVTSFLPGRVELDPPDLRKWVRRLAKMLVQIHAVPPPSLETCEYMPYAQHPWLVALGDAGLARDAHELASRAPDPSAAVLSHGDFQHFNVLWEGADRPRIRAVVDWPTAGLADRGLDVGHCRLNLAVLFSADAAMWFLDDYEQAAGVHVDPATDVAQLLGFSLQWPEFIPIQVAGRRAVDGPGMAPRVRETIRRTLDRAG
ncbi:phosphotransferase [Brachybacterium halotolerans subsp. kimchii]|uniref:phosphotransferase family protein n=1 Tax=Brachybacterium halotolerans TaxID=2795215 RepID=UPI001E5D019F|nr:phosphotransferase [Brachybacterium halotolerans]UEJ81881.1 phosphotransferase [Brachybacterium halotolerans subsp. kimchii]